MDGYSVLVVCPPQPFVEQLELRLQGSALKRLAGRGSGGGYHSGPVEGRGVENAQRTPIDIYIYIYTHKYTRYVEREREIYLLIYMHLEDRQIDRWIDR